MDTGAVLKLAEQQSASTLVCDAAAFEKSFFVEVFADLSGCAVPTTVTAEGTIFKFAQSGSGSSNCQGFYVQDKDNDLLKFVAHGGWADSEVLKVGNRVQIFWAKASYGKGDYAKQVTLWIYEDSYIHVLEKSQPLKQEGKTIALG